MNLRIADAPDLVRFLHLVVSDSCNAVLSGNTKRVVESHGRVFFLRDDPLELGGPFESVEALIRSEGIRRNIGPEGNGSPIEVVEWDGWFYRMGSGEVRRFSTAEEALASRSTMR